MWGPQKTFATPREISIVTSRQILSFDVGLKLLTPYCIATVAIKTNDAGATNVWLHTKVAPCQELATSMRAQ